MIISYPMVMLWPKLQYLLLKKVQDALIIVEMEKDSVFTQRLNGLETKNGVTEMLRFMVNHMKALQRGKLRLWVVNISRP